MKINKITIRNFKVFKTINLPFDSNDLVVFDGPNGFGKTSIYDAIELVFTGQIRRYSALHKLVIDGRESFDEHPFYNEDADGDISISIQFEKNETIYNLERVALQSEITNWIDFSIYKLYKKESFETNERILIEDEKAFLTSILGNNYKENFQFLNYVEQEDSLYLLKNHDKSRKQSIAHLFNVSEFEHKIQIIGNLKKKIDSLCGLEEKEFIKTLNAEIKELETSIAKDFDAEEFNVLFPGKDIAWDIENYDFKAQNYNSLMGTDGTIASLVGLVKDKENFRSFYINDIIDKLISEKATLNNFLKLNYFIPQKEELKKAKTKYIASESLRKNLVNFNSSNLEIDSTVFFDSTLDYITESEKENFIKSVRDLSETKNELNKLESIYSSIKESREKLIASLEALKIEAPETSGACVLCGHLYKDLDEQLENITAHSQELKKLATEKSAAFGIDFEKMKIDAINPIVASIDKYISENQVDVNFINQLENLGPTSFSTVLKNLEIISFNTEEYLNKIAKNTEETKIDILVNDLTGLKGEVISENIGSSYKEYFTSFFNDNFDELYEFETEKIEKKSRYLKYLYSLQQNEFIASQKEKLATLTLKLKNAEAIKEQLKKVKKIYDDSLIKYQKKVIKDIEIIFHIYSGRIMQNFHGGLGLFIHSDRNGIRFQTNPKKTYDAVFSMSSGQLSALIISFTLALHKKYSQNQLVLIDDPIQTMDELNIVGFVELMRNEFINNQIIISTHEDMMSSYIRYKFEGYNLSHRRINLKTWEEN